MKSKIEQRDEFCLFCKKERKNEWKSAFYIVNLETKNVLDKFTICPQCRKFHRIQEIYFELVSSKEALQNSHKVKQRGEKQ